MKPDVHVVLGGFAGTLLMEMMPQLPSDYAQKTLGLVGALLAAAAEEWDKAAEWRVEENRALRKLLSDAAAVVADDELRGRVREEAGGSSESLRLSALEAENARLRVLLIDLQAAVESLDSQGARRVEAAVWDELRLSTERRKLSFHPF
jgi:hypothetical protein